MDYNETIQRLKKHQKIYDKLTRKFEDLLTLEKKLQEFNADILQLKEYYANNWLQDVTVANTTIDDKNQPPLLLSITSQDEIWNFFEEFDAFNDRVKIF